MQSAGLEDGLAAGDHLLALLLGDLGQGKRVPGQRRGEPKPGLEPPTYRLLPGDEHARRHDGELESIGILDREVGIASDYVGIEKGDREVAAGLRDVTRHAHE